MISVQCTCGKTLRVKPEFAGKKARCPACSGVVRIPAASTSPDLVAIESPPPELPSPPPAPDSDTYSLQSLPLPDLEVDEPASPSVAAVANTPPIPTPLPPTPTTRFHRFIIPAATALASLTVGYFIGREHMKLQLRAALADVSTLFRDNPILDPGAIPEHQLTEPATRPLPQLALGETHHSKRSSITLDSASIDYVQVEEIGDDIAQSETPNLILSFTVSNDDERRILQFWRGDSDGPGHFRLRDDVGNSVRSVTFGYTRHPVGSPAVKELEPGLTSVHVEVFAVPLPKTQHLILTVDLACISGKGKIEYQIPFASIRRLAPAPDAAQ